MMTTAIAVVDHERVKEHHRMTHTRESITNLGRLGATTKPKGDSGAFSPILCQYQSVYSIQVERSID